ncbi:LysR family transcriptional regulator [Rhodomicrobium lacus]|uniref:LysR family transcriptional regulator n=1 Tax=Rhodomicrobium lacus TaxID=2498452 RepID=UPI0026E206BE|nr:LysR family transcriptional regulator [Rhodomicrobium lacus]WKW49978.1 LysR family transcriptional regulator [Rhodomicrobium lacus]
MLDTLSLDQLRLFIAAAEEGSFSAAGRRLNRAQSVISQTILNLEAQLGVALFDRSGRYPVLTDQGRILLADAKGILRATDALKARAKGMAAGLEPELSVVVDVMFPMRVLTKVAALFGTVFPGTSLRLYVEALGGVAKAVLSRQCALGVMGSLTLERPELLRERLLGVRMVVVTSPRHALAAFHGPKPRCMLADHLQLVLTDRTDLSEGQEFNVLSPRNWRLADMSAKHAFLREGLGWGSMPFDMVERDLAEGELVEIELQDADGANFIMSMHATYRTDAPPGPAGRWLINRLKEA